MCRAGLRDTRPLSFPSVPRGRAHLSLCHHFSLVIYVQEMCADQKDTNSSVSRSFLRQIF